MAKESSKKKVNHEELKRRKDHFTFFICLLIAALAWLLIKLSDDYTVSYPLKVLYAHVPADQILETPEDSVVTVGFKTDGYNLLDLMMTGRLKTMKVDLSHVKKEPLGNDNYRISTLNLKENVAAQLDVNEGVLNFSSSYLFIQFKTLEKKEVPVALELQLQFKSQFGLYTSKISPAMVQIYGTKEMLDSIQSIKTVPIVMNNLDSDQKVEVSLVNPYPEKIRIEPEKIKVDLDVEKYTEFSIKVPVDVSQISPAIKTFPTEITVYYNMFLKDYKDLTPDQFKVVPDIKNLKLKDVKFLNLRLEDKPADAHNARLDPVSVEFIILN
ncbi:MAG: YbbR-like domain-containing protein [Bacteroidales bacterium]|nr:YbbR-like domain-containing protein [Bacteroidales bacterium]